ncbi:hypothetical protein [Mesorhizobium sp. 128a]
MQIQAIYAALAAANMDQAEQFYTQLFERGPDDRPMEGLIQWRDIAGANPDLPRPGACRLREADHCRTENASSP